MYEEEFFDEEFGEIMELIQQYEAALKENKSPYFDQSNYERIAAYYHDNREFKKALNVVDKALEQYPFSSEFLLQKAELLGEQNKPDEALEVLGYAESLDPSNVDVALIRADIYLYKGEHDIALAEINRGLKLANENDERCELYLEMADVYEDLEQYYEVIDCLKMAIKQDPENEEALNRIWFAFELTERFEQSVAFHKELLNNHPYNLLGWFNIGHAYTGLKRYDDAAEAFELSLAINEEFEPGHTCLGDVKFLKEDYHSAITSYLEAIKLIKPYKELFLKVAECYEKLEDNGKSRAFLRKAIGVDPYYDEAFYKIGESYKIDEEWQKAISSLERALKLSKDNVESMSALAEAYLNGNEVEKAVELFERILEVDPKTKTNWLNLAAAYFEIGSHREAFVVLNEASVKFEKDADVFYIKAVFYLQVGNRNEGLVNLEKGLLLSFEDHEMIFELDENLVNDELVLQMIDQYS